LRLYKVNIQWKITVGFLFTNTNLEKYSQVNLFFKIVPVSGSQNSLSQIY
jgi:hypothetical protein